MQLDTTQLTQTKAIIPQAPLTTLGQETRWAYAKAPEPTR